MQLSFYIDQEEIQQQNILFRRVSLAKGRELEKDIFLRVNCLVCNLSGEMEYHYGACCKELPFCEKSMLFMSVHSNCMLKAKTDVELLIIGFGELFNLCDKFTFQSLVPIQELLKYEFEPLDIRNPLDDFLVLMETYLEDGFEVKNLFKEKLKELFILFRAYYSKEELAMFFYPLVAKSVDFKVAALTNFSYNLNLEEWAEACHYNKRAFQRYFREIFGVAPEQWVAMEKAKQIRYYLSVTGIGLKEIAERLCFDSAVHLNKFCKTWFGMSPTDLKKTLILQGHLK